MGHQAIDELCEAMQTTDFARTDFFTEDVVLDATVPNWRFTVRGAETLREQFGHWFADEARFETLSRTPLPDGELVEFTLCWQEHGVPHACHQAHIIRIADGKIASDLMFCGGRWPASLLAKMDEAAHAH